MYAMSIVRYLGTYGRWCDVKKANGRKRQLMALDMA